MSEDELQIRREVTLHAAREDVWSALTEPELIERWLADEVDLDPREGGEVRFRYENGEERRGRVEEIVPAERLRIRWRRERRSESEVEFVLADAAAGTRLLVIESGAALAHHASSAVWADRLLLLEVMCLDRSVAALPSA